MHLPTVLNGSEMARLIAALETDKHRALVMLAYGADYAKRSLQALH